MDKPPIPRVATALAAALSTLLAAAPVVAGSEGRVPDKQVGEPGMIDDGVVRVQVVPLAVPDRGG